MAYTVLKLGSDISEASDFAYKQRVVSETAVSLRSSADLSFTTSAYRKGAAVRKNTGNGNFVSCGALFVGNILQLFKQLCIVGGRIAVPARIPCRINTGFAV